MTEKKRFDNYCCFTGHRPNKIEISNNALKEKLRTAVNKAICDGFTYFITGMALGVDLCAAEVVLEEKKKHPDKNIILICACPYKGFENRWSEFSKKRYNDIMNRSDVIVFVGSVYTPWCFQTRNKYMVDRCSRLIAYFDGTPGGTKNTVTYAKKCGIEIINVY